MKLCLIGSTKFKSEYETINRQLSIAGHVVYSVACFGNSGDALTEGEKEMLDLVHLQKILESDEVVIVTDNTGYYGDSTRREIHWAKMLRKRIHSSQHASHINHLVKYMPQHIFPCEY